MKLTNTIEFEPYLFSEKEYKMPTGSRKEMPDEWDKYWRNYLKDSQLEYLIAIEKGTYLVDIETLSDLDLTIFLKKILEDIDINEYEDQLSAISGGICIVKNDEILIGTQCCGDLSDLANWENIFDSKQNNWEQLWFGHPWVFYKKNGNFIDFSDYFDGNNDVLNNFQVKYQFSTIWLQKELENIKEGQNRLAIRIEQILEKLTIPNFKEISKILFGD